MAKHKFPSISLTVEIERFRRNFRPTGYLRNAIFAIFPKFSPPPKMAAILNFRIFAKNGKTQISFYLLTVRDRAISSKSLDLARLRSIEGNLQSLPILAKIFPSPKNGGHFRGGEIFEFLPKMARIQCSNTCGSKILTKSLYLAWLRR